jgi:hypothetical protein
VAVEDCLTGENGMGHGVSFHIVIHIILTTVGYL